MVASMDIPAKGGFSFDPCRWNSMLGKTGLKVPGFRKTGATVVGLVFADGVLGTATRATEGPIVADKNCEKIYYMDPNIYCCGAGTAADTEAVTAIKVMLALHLFLVELIVLDRIYTVYPHGSVDTLPFATMGSGSLAAMSVFESKYKEGLTREEGIQLVSEAICAASSTTWVVVAMSMFVDQYSVVPSESKRRRIVSQFVGPCAEDLRQLQRDTSFVQGQTDVLSTEITPLIPNAEIPVGDAMEE